MRGDRPLCRPCKSPLSSAAPHARGSTLRRAIPARPASGCPACAGIDPVRTTSTASRRWLPRMRGDRPALSTASPCDPGAAPHARGSTVASRRGRALRCGCPACAGIDLQQEETQWQRMRLPRMRGDRPGESWFLARCLEAAPHARGSTLLRQLPSGAPPGCPACAGIDPSATTSTRRRCGLPRMRGDRPAQHPRANIRHPAAPHARGSTQQVCPIEARTEGCPACAGIDPSRAR